MSADNFWGVVPIDGQFGIAMGFESNAEWPTPKPQSPRFAFAADAVAKAYELDEIDWTEYGIKLHPDVVEALRGARGKQLLTEQESSDFAEILRLHDEAFKHYLLDDAGHKSSEGAVELYFGNFWDRNGYEDPGAPGKVGVSIYSYALGPSRTHTFDTIAEGLINVRKWHAEEMNRGLDR